MRHICHELVKSYLLYQNPLYAFSFPISMIAAIVVYGICVSFKCSTNSYMLQILIPIFTIIVVNILISFIAERMIDREELEKYNVICSSILKDGSIRLPETQRVSNGIENMENKEENSQKGNSGESALRSQLPIIDNLYNDTVEVINPDNTPFMLPYTQAENRCKIA